MNKKIYTLQQYKMVINGEEFFHFTTKYYLTEYENALFSFGKSTICKDIRPFSETFQTNKKQAEEVKKGLENSFDSDPDYKLWHFTEQGAFSDYDWQWNEEEKTNYGTLKEER